MERVSPMTNNTPKWEEELEKVIRDSFVIIDSHGNGIDGVVDFVKSILLEHDRELKSILEKDLEKYSKQAVDSTDTKNLDEAIGICKYIGEKMKSLLVIDEESK